MDRRSALTILAGAPALTALPPLPAFAATTQPDAATRAAAARILAKYKSDPAFRALVQRSPIQAFRQFGMRASIAARVLAYELGASRACGGTGTCLTKGAEVTGGCQGQKNALTQAQLTKAQLTKGGLTKGAPAENGFDEIAVCALTFGGSPPADFAAHAGLPPATDAKGWRSLISAQPAN